MFTKHTHIHIHVQKDKSNKQFKKLLKKMATMIDELNLKIHQLQQEITNLNDVVVREKEQANLLVEIREQLKAQVVALQAIIDSGATPEQLATVTEQLQGMINQVSEATLHVSDIITEELPAPTEPDTTEQPTEGTPSGDESVPGE